MIDTIRTLVPGWSAGDPIYECRQCGTTVDETMDVCPACSAESIVRYDIN